MKPLSSKACPPGWACCRFDVVDLACQVVTPGPGRGLSPKRLLAVRLVRLVRLVGRLARGEERDPGRPGRPDLNLEHIRTRGALCGV